MEWINQIELADISLIHVISSETSFPLTSILSPEGRGRKKFIDALALFKNAI
jgi:hypothetical protein